MMEKEEDCSIAFVAFSGLTLLRRKGHKGGRVWCRSIGYKDNAHDIIEARLFACFTASVDACGECGLDALPTIGVYSAFEHLNASCALTGTGQALCCFVHRLSVRPQRQGHVDSR